MATGRNPAITAWSPAATAVPARARAKVRNLASTLHQKLATRLVTAERLAFFRIE
jgi:hypothetical protein